MSLKGSGFIERKGLHWFRLPNARAQGTIVVLCKEGANFKCCLKTVRVEQPIPFRTPLGARHLQQFDGITEWIFDVNAGCPVSVFR